MEWVINDPNIVSNIVKGNATVVANFAENVRTYTLTVVTDPAGGSYGTVTEASVTVDAGAMVT